MSPQETVNASLQQGAIEAVTDAGEVTLRLPNGGCVQIQIPLEHVMRVRAASERAARPQPNERSGP